MMELEGRMSKDKSTTDLKKKKEKRKKKKEKRTENHIHFSFYISSTVLPSFNNWIWKI